MKNRAHECAKNRHIFRKILSHRVPAVSLRQRRTAVPERRGDWPATGCACATRAISNLLLRYLSAFLRSREACPPMIPQRHRPANSILADRNVPLNQPGNPIQGILHKEYRVRVFFVVHHTGVTGTRITRGKKYDNSAFIDLVLFSWIKLSILV